MGLLKLILGPPSIEKVGSKLYWQIARTSFRVFRDEKFRRMLEFEKMEQLEQDRIFNEFIVNGLLLICLKLEILSQMAKGKKKDFFHDLGEKIFYSHNRELASRGAEEKYCDLWKDLMMQRYRQLHDDHDEYVKYKKEKASADPWPTIVGIAAIHHIRRNNTSPEDPVYNENILPWIKEITFFIDKTLFDAVRRL